MSKRGTTRLFLFSYASAASVILILAIAAFAITQLSLNQETDALRSEAKYRTLAFTTNTGMLRSQRIFRNTILLLTNTNVTQSTQELTVDYPIWQHVHDTIVHGDSHLSIAPSDFSASEQAQMRGEEADYQSINAALAQVLAFEKRPGTHTDTKTLRTPVTTIFFAIPRYLKALYQVYVSLNNNADSYAAQSTGYIDHERFFSIVVLATTIVTLILEAVLIILPANKKMESLFASLTTSNQQVSNMRTALR